MLFSVSDGLYGILRRWNLKSRLAEQEVGIGTKAFPDLYLIGIGNSRKVVFIFEEREHDLKMEVRCPVSIFQVVADSPYQLSL